MILHRVLFFFLAHSEALAPSTLCVSLNFSRRERGEITDEQCKLGLASPTAIPLRIHRISLDIRSSAAQGPVSIRLGTRLGTP
jgi:hypothetical protein